MMMLAYATTGLAVAAYGVCVYVILSILEQETLKWLLDRDISDVGARPWPQNYEMAPTNHGPRRVKEHQMWANGTWINISTFLTRRGIASCARTCRDGKAAQQPMIWRICLGRRRAQLCQCWIDLATDTKQSIRFSRWEAMIKEEVEAIRKRTSEQVDPETGRVKIGFPRPTYSEQEQMKAMERHLGKLSFNVGIRAVYLAEKKYFNGTSYNGVRWLWRPMRRIARNLVASTKSSRIISWPRAYPRQESRAAGEFAPLTWYLFRYVLCGTSFGIFKEVF